MHHKEPEFQVLLTLQDPSSGAARFSRLWLSVVSWVLQAWKCYPGAAPAHHLHHWVLQYPQAVSPRCLQKRLQPFCGAKISRSGGTSSCLGTLPASKCKWCKCLFDQNLLINDNSGLRTMHPCEILSLWRRKVTPCLGEVSSSHPGTRAPESIFSNTNLHKATAEAWLLPVVLSF